MIEPTTIDGLVRRAVDARSDTETLADAPDRATFDGGLPQRLTWTEVDARTGCAQPELKAPQEGRSNGTYRYPSRTQTIHLPCHDSLVVPVVSNTVGVATERTVLLFQFSLQ